MIRTRPPFPGMDPWLEDVRFWPDLQKHLILAVCDVLRPSVRRDYLVDAESRTLALSPVDQDRLYSSHAVPDTDDGDCPVCGSPCSIQNPPKAEPFRVTIPMPPDEVEEWFLTIKELPSRRLVTVIEVLSPASKKTRDIREGYSKRRRELLESGVNLVEVDLLRSGKPMPPKLARLSSTYRVLIFRSHERRYAHLWGFSFRTKIPNLPIPLLSGDDELPLNLTGILHDLYDRQGYELVIDYRHPPSPPLRKEDQAWAAEIIAQAAVRPSQDPVGGETSP